LGDRGCAEDAKGPRNSTKTGTGSFDAFIDETMGMAPIGAMVVIVRRIAALVVMVMRMPTVSRVMLVRERDGSHEQEREVSVLRLVRMLVNTAPVAVQIRAGHAPQGYGSHR
jgi:hypothetical protein